MTVIIKQAKLEMPLNNDKRSLLNDIFKRNYILFEIIYKKSFFNKKNQIVKLLTTKFYKQNQFHF